MKPDVETAAISPSTTSRQAGLSLVRSTGFVSSISAIAFGLVFIIFGLWLGSSFLSVKARMLDAHANTPVLLVALALAICLIAGEFDLSVGSMVTLTAYLSVGLVVNQNWPMWLVIAASLAVGVLGGLANALLVVVMRVNAFIATLGVGGILLGLSRVYSGGTQLSPTGDSPQLPDWFSGSEGAFGSFQTKTPTWLVLTTLVVLVVAIAWAHAGPTISRTKRVPVLVGLALSVAVLIIYGSSIPSSVPMTVAFLLVVTTLLWLVLRYTELGRYLYATGGNTEAARLAGVRVRAVTTGAFVTSGLLSAIGGIVLAARQGSASPDIGVGFLLPAFAAAFLSIVIFSSGRFHVWGTVVGGLFLIFVSQGLIVGGVPFTWAEVLNGSVLVAAVSLSTFFKRLSGT